MSKQPDPQTTNEAIIQNLAMMLRRMIWTARQEMGDTSMKVLAGKADQLLASYGIKTSEKGRIPNG